MVNGRLCFMQQTTDLNRRPQAASAPTVTNRVAYCRVLCSGRWRYIGDNAMLILQALRAGDTAVTNQNEEFAISNEPKPRR